MTLARIYRPAKTAMQSGRGNTDQWILEFEPEAPRRPEPLMGWTSSTDTRQQLRLRFPSREAAEAYARREGIAFRVETPRDPAPKVATYSDNFRHDRPGPWTH